MTELSRHMPASEASAIQIALDGLLSLIAQAAERASRAEAEGTATRAWDCDDEDLDMDTPDDVLLETPTTRHRKRRARNVPCGQTSNQIENRCRSAGGGSCG